MTCPTCNRHEDKDPICCEQCHKTYHKKCQPYWDFAGFICQTCQENNSVAVVSERKFTERLRSTFNKKVKAPIEPRLVPPLPWRVVRAGDVWALYSGAIPVAAFDKKDAAEWACKAANEHYTLLGVAHTVYERIRKGQGWYDGGESDCSLWSSVKNILK